MIIIHPDKLNIMSGQYVNQPNIVNTQVKIKTARVLNFVGLGQKVNSWGSRIYNIARLPTLHQKFNIPLTNSC